MPYLFPVTDDVVDYEAKQAFRRVGDTLVAELKRKGPDPEAFSGLIAFDEQGGFEFRAVPGPVPTGGKLLAGLGAEAILWAVLGAIAGGMLLNLMPCVFPILTLKALHLSRAGGDVGEARRDALAYTAGAVVGTGALGVALLAVRAAGTEVGWAFQLQDPRTILVLLLLATAITLNLLRLYEIPAAGSTHLVTGSFGTGALAAFVATPCAGPFLGTALGAALLLPPAGSMLIFAALGLGLAIPFLLVAFIPRLRSKLPRPGPWMARLQRFLAIPMAATAIACLWLLWRLGGAKMFEIGLVSMALFGDAAGWGRPLAAQRQADWLCRDAHRDRRCRSFGLGASRSLDGDGARDRGRPDLERRGGAVRARRGRSSLRLFHRRLVPDLQGQ